MINDRGVQDEVPLPSGPSNNLKTKCTEYFLRVAEKSLAVGKTVFPDERENTLDPEESADPLEEEKHRHGCVVHKYPDRVLFLATNKCAVHCRYCTRSRVVSDDKQSEPDLYAGIQYVREHPEVRDVLVSGGDPLTMPLGQLKELLTELKKIEHVEMLRIGTKVPVVAPHLVTDVLVTFLKTLHPLFMSIHFTHPDEVTPEVKAACNKLADAGIPLGSQTVLLKDINDDATVLKKLFHELLKIRVRPYYMYSADKTPGSKHFWVPVEKGVEIMRELRVKTTGYAVPTFVVDSPKGKLPVDLGYDTDLNSNIEKSFEGPYDSF